MQDDDSRVERMLDTELKQCRTEWPSTRTWTCSKIHYEWKDVDCVWHVD